MEHEEEEEKRGVDVSSTIDKPPFKINETIKNNNPKYLVEFERLEQSVNALLVLIKTEMPEWTVKQPTHCEDSFQCYVRARDEIIDHTFTFHIEIWERKEEVEGQTLVGFRSTVRIYHWNVLEPVDKIQRLLETSELKWMVTRQPYPRFE